MKTGFQRKSILAVMSILFICAIPANCPANESCTKATTAEIHYPYITSTLPGKQEQPAVGKREAQILKNLSCNKEVESVLDEALQYAKPLSANDLRHASKYGDQVRYARKSGDEVRYHHLYLLPDIMVNYADAGCFEKAKEILAQLEGPLLKGNSFLKILRMDLSESMIRVGLPDSAEDLIRTLDGSEDQDNLLVRLAALHVQLGDYSKADNLIKEVEENTHDKFKGRATTRLVTILVKKGLLTAAERYATEADGSAYSNESLIGAAAGYIRQKQIMKAEVLISKALGSCKMSDDNCDFELLQIAQAYYKGGKPETAIEYANRIVDVDPRMQALIEIACSTSDESVALKAVETARTLADQCSGEDCTYVAFWISKGYGAAGLADKALNYLNKHFPKDPISKSVGLDDVVRQLAKRGKIKDAQTLLNQSETSLTNQMKQAIAVAELKNGNLESALSIVESIPNSHVQFGVAITLAKVKPDFPFIERWLSKTRPDDRHIETYGGTVQVLLAAAARNGQMTEARNYIETMDNSFLKARGLIGIAQGLLQKQPGEEWAKSINLTW